jgi:hypothetical protein
MLATAQQHATEDSDVAKQPSRDEKPPSGCLKGHDFTENEGYWLCK